MYSDPRKVRTVVRSVRFSEEEDELVQAIVKYTGQQLGTLLREYAFEHIRMLLAGKVELDSMPSATEATKQLAQRAQ